MYITYPSPVRIGMIGCGGYAFELIKRVGVLPRHLQLVAATSRNSGSDGTRYCAKHNIKVFKTLDEMLNFAPGEIDVIMNSSPIHVHKETTLQCLDAGFPVWLEKPPVATIADFDELLNASKRTGLPVEVCFNSLYSNLVQRLKSELVSGVYGRVLRIRGVAAITRTEAYFTRTDWAGRLKMDNRWIFDGTINNPLAHLLCNNLYFSAYSHHALAEPERIESYLWHANAIDSEDTSSIRIITRDNVEILCNLTLCAEKEIQPLTVIDTEKAVIRLHNYSRIEIDRHDGEKEIRESYMENRMHMLLELTFQLQTGKPSLCPLEICRPFTEVVETSFRQVLNRTGNIPAVASSIVERIPRGNSTSFQISGIDDALREAHETGTQQPMLDLLGESL